MRAMILAAGLGTRLKPFTDSHPKALAVVNKKTLLQRNIEYLHSFGISDIIVNIHHFPNQIRDYVRNHNGFGANIVFSDETDAVLETGGGLMKASWYLSDSDPFVLMNVDILTDMNLIRMIEAHQKQKHIATLAVTRRNTSRYFLFDDSGQLVGWENTKTGEKKISRSAANYVPKGFSGIHVLSPKIFEVITETGKFSMTGVYLNLAKRYNISSFDHTGTKFIDVGRPESITEAEKIFS